MTWRQYCVYSYLSLVTLSSDRVWLSTLPLLPLLGSIVGVSQQDEVKPSPRMVSLKAKKHKQHSEKFPRYIIITPSDTINDLRKPSPFLIEKFLNHNIGSLKNVKMLRSGHMLIECDSASHSNKLLNLSDLMSSSQFNQIQTFCCFL